MAYRTWAVGGVEEEIVRRLYRSRGAKFCRERILAMTGREVSVDAIGAKARSMGVTRGDRRTSTPAPDVEAIESRRERIESQYGEPLEQVVAGYLVGGIGLAQAANILGVLAVDLAAWMDHIGWRQHELVAWYRERLKNGGLAYWEPKDIDGRRAA